MNEVIGCAAAAAAPPPPWSQCRGALVHPSEASVPSLPVRAAVGNPPACRVVRLGARTHGVVALTGEGLSPLDPRRKRLLTTPLLAVLVSRPVLRDARGLAGKGLAEVAEQRRRAYERTAQQGPGSATPYSQKGLEPSAMPPPGRLPGPLAGSASFAYATASASAPPSPLPQPSGSSGDVGNGKSSTNKGLFPAAGARLFRRCRNEPSVAATATTTFSRRPVV